MVNACIKLNVDSIKCVDICVVGYISSWYILYVIESSYERSVKICFPLFRSFFPQLPDRTITIPM